MRRALRLIPDAASLRAAHRLGQHVASFRAAAAIGLTLSCGIVVSGADKQAAEAHARALAAAAPRLDEVRVLGPAEAPLALVRGRYRFRILVKAPRNYDLSAYLREWLAKAPKKKGNIKLEVDVDPQSFL